MRQLLLSVVCVRFYFPSAFNSSLVLDPCFRKRSATTGEFKAASEDITPI